MASHRQDESGRHPGAAFEGQPPAQVTWYDTSKPANTLDDAARARASAMQGFRRAPRPSAAPRSQLAEAFPSFQMMSVGGMRATVPPAALRPPTVPRQVPVPKKRPVRSMRASMGAASPMKNPKRQLGPAKGTGLKPVVPKAKKARAAFVPPVVREVPRHLRAPQGSTPLSAPAVSSLVKKFGTEDWVASVQLAAEAAAASVPAPAAAAAEDGMATAGQDGTLRPLVVAGDAAVSAAQKLVAASDPLNDTTEGRVFRAHRSKKEVLEGLRRGRMFIGTLHCGHASGGRSGSVRVPALSCSIALPDIPSMNRAMHGDVVAVELQRGSGLAADKGGFNVLKTAQQPGQGLLHEVANAGQVTGWLLGLVSARVGTVARILRRECPAVHICRVLPDTPNFVFPVDTRLPGLFCRVPGGEGASKQLVLAKMTGWTANEWRPSGQVQCKAPNQPVHIPWSINEPHSMALPLQVQLGALLGGVVEDASLPQWVGYLPGVRARWSAWRKLQKSATTAMRAYSLPSAEVGRRAAATPGSVAAAYKEVATLDPLAAALQGVLVTVAENCGLMLTTEQSSGVIPAVSVDPAGAVDLDDAFTAVRLPEHLVSGTDLTHRLFVHIADISHVLCVAFFTGSQQAAQQEEGLRTFLQGVFDRGASVYPGLHGLKQRQPMVPEQVERAASLLGGVLRPCLTVVMDISSTSGATRLVTIGEAIITNLAPMTYPQASSILQGTMPLAFSEGAPECIPCLGPGPSGPQQWAAPVPALAATLRAAAVACTAVADSRQLALTHSSSGQTGQPDLSPRQKSDMLDDTLTVLLGGADFTAQGSNAGATPNTSSKALVEGLMVLVNSAAGAVLSASQQPHTSFWAQPPPPVQAMHAIASWCSLMGVPFDGAAGLGLKSPWPTGGAPPADLTAQHQLLVGKAAGLVRCLRQPAGYVSLADIQTRPDIVPSILQVPSSIEGGSPISASAAVFPVQTLAPTCPLPVVGEAQDEVPAELHHTTLGLQTYAHFSSPLRRGSDLLNHFHLAALLQAGPSPDRCGLQRPLSQLVDCDAALSAAASANQRETTAKSLMRDCALRTGLSKRSMWAVSTPALQSSRPELIPLALPGLKARVPAAALSSMKAGKGLVLPQRRFASLVPTTPTATPLPHPISTTAMIGGMPVWGLYSCQNSSSWWFPRSQLQAIILETPISLSHKEGGAVALQAEAGPGAVVHVGHCDTKAGLSPVSVPTQVVNASMPDGFTSLTHYLLIMAGALWSEACNATVAASGIGSYIMLDAALVMHAPRGDHNSSWGTFSTMKASKVDRPGGAAAVTPLGMPAGVLLVEAQELFGVDASLLPQQASQQDAPVVIPSAEAWHQAAGQAAAVLYPPIGQNLKRVKSGVPLPLVDAPRRTSLHRAGAGASGEFKVAGTAHTLLIPEPGVPSRQRPTAGSLCILTLPCIGWTGRAVVSKLGKRTNLLPTTASEVPIAEERRGQLGQTAAPLINSVIPITVVFMADAPPLPHAVANPEDALAAGMDTFPRLPIVLGWQAQFIASPPMVHRQLEVLSALHAAAVSETQSSPSKADLVTAGASYHQPPLVLHGKAMQTALNLLHHSNLMCDCTTHRSLSNSVRVLAEGHLTSSTGATKRGVELSGAADWFWLPLLPVKLQADRLSLGWAALPSSPQKDQPALLLPARMGALLPTPEVIGDLAPDANASQQAALLQAMQLPVSLIHGPPGTGKTTIGSRLCCLFAVANMHRAVARAVVASAGAVEDVNPAKALPLMHSHAPTPTSFDFGRVDQVLFCAPSHRAVNVLAKRLWGEVDAVGGKLDPYSPVRTAAYLNWEGPVDMRLQLRQPTQSPPLYASFLPVGGARAKAPAPAAPTSSDGWGAPAGAAAAVDAAPTSSLSPFDIALAQQVAPREAAELSLLRGTAAPASSIKHTTVVRIFPQHLATAAIEKQWRAGAAAGALGADACGKLEAEALKIDTVLDKLGVVMSTRAVSDVSDEGEKVDPTSSAPYGMCLHTLVRDPEVCADAILLLAVEYVMRLESARQHLQWAVRTYCTDGTVPALVAAALGDDEALAALHDDMSTPCRFPLPQNPNLAELGRTRDSILQAAEQHVLANAHIVLATAAEAGSSRVVKYCHPRQVILDEAAFCGELESLVPLQLAQKVIMVGDHKQLPAVLASPSGSPAWQRLRASLFERLHSKATMMSLQYRMHPAIAAFPSAYFYNSRLRSAPGLAADRRLAFQAFPWICTNHPVRFVDVQGIERCLSRGSAGSAQAPPSEQYVQGMLAALAKLEEVDAVKDGTQEAWDHNCLGAPVPLAHFSGSAPGGLRSITTLSEGAAEGSLLATHHVLKSGSDGLRAAASAAVRTSAGKSPAALALASHPASYANVEEASMALLSLACVLASGKVFPHQVAVLSPYKAQVSLLTLMLHRCAFPVQAGSDLAATAAPRPLPPTLHAVNPFTRRPPESEVVYVSGSALMSTGLTVSSVHMGQGSERDVVILSTVRSNPQAAHRPVSIPGTLGFVANEQLMNVAITRAKHALLVVGHAATLQHHSMWRQWLADAHEKGALLPSPVRENGTTPW